MLLLHIFEDGHHAPLCFFPPKVVNFGIVAEGHRTLSMPLFHKNVDLGTEALPEV